MLVARYWTCEHQQQNQDTGTDPLMLV